MIYEIFSIQELKRCVHKLSNLQKNGFEKIAIEVVDMQMAKIQLNIQLNTVKLPIEAPGFYQYKCGARTSKSDPRPVCGARHLSGARFVS